MTVSVHILRVVFITRALHVFNKINKNSFSKSVNVNALFASLSARLSATMITELYLCVRVFHAIFL